MLTLNGHEIRDTVELRGLTSEINMTTKITAGKIMERTIVVDELLIDGVIHSNVPVTITQQMKGTKEWLTGHTVRKIPYGEANTKIEINL